MNPRTLLTLARGFITGLAFMAFSIGDAPLGVFELLLLALSFSFSFSI